MRKTPLWLAVAFVAVGAFEGVKLQAYPDLGGVWTICQGETKGVKRGDVATREQCDAKLYARLQQFNAEISACLPDNLPESRRAAFVSLAYNIGSSQFCKSTVARRINSGDVQGACDAMRMWNQVKGVKVQGLISRREKERELCLQGE